jgi:hypothetical protein
MAVTESIALIHIPRPGDAHPALSGRRRLDASTKEVSP